MLRKKEASFGGAPVESGVKSSKKTKKLNDIDLSSLSGLNEQLEKELKEEAASTKKTSSGCGCGW